MLEYRDSLLLRYVGLHAITLYGQKMFFVVMESVFATDLPVHERFDLKGSWVGRRSQKLVDKRRGVRRVANSEWPQFTSAPLLPGFREVRKDLDLTRPLILHPADAAGLGAQLKIDADFLARHRIMDYSLLLGIHNQHFRVRVRPMRAAPGSGGGGSGNGSLDGGGADAQGAGGGGGRPAADPLAAGPAGRTDGGGADGAARAQGGALRQRKAAARGGGGALPAHRAHMGGMPAVVVEGPGVYFMGIIDILQTFTWKKRCARPAAVGASAALCARCLRLCCRRQCRCRRFRYWPQALLLRPSLPTVDSQPASTQRVAGAPRVWGVRTSL